MKIPARCNRRSCQARRNLSKRPEQYAQWPRCHYKGCPGRMYVDEYRLRKGEHDKAPLCHGDCYPYPHRYDCPNCRHYEDWVTERALRPRSKHHPLPQPHRPVEAPF